MKTTNRFLAIIAILLALHLVRNIGVDSAHAGKKDVLEVRIVGIEKGAFERWEAIKIKE